MPGFPGRAESEDRESGHELIWGEGCLNTLGRDGAWVGWDTWVLFRNRLGRVGVEECRER